MSAQEQIEHIRRDLIGTGNHPTNEANTRSWVILPLLKQCGYAYYEISEQEYNGNNQFPDYTILPNTAHTWYLEAKSWTHTLHANDANQALNYANTQGKRWVVLSNGRVWQLYDGHLVGVPTPQRLMAIARLDSPGELESLLSALHKTSVQSDALAQFAIRGRLVSLLAEELPDANSELVKAITKNLRSRPGLTALTPHSIAVWFEKQLSPASIPPIPPATSKKVILPSISSSVIPLSELLDKPATATGQTPRGLLLPDGTFQAAHTWRDITIELIKWLYLNKKTPTLPFSGQSKGKRYLLNTTPNHVSEPMKTNQYKSFVVANQTVYIHINRSARDFIHCLGKLCVQVGESAANIRFEFD